MTNDRQKTEEQLRQELYAKLKQEQASQHLCEVATPGVVRNVNLDEASSSK